MANYWIGDSAGRVLGPLSLTSLQELFAKGRLRGTDRVSLDGKSYAPLSQFPEVARVAAAAAAVRGGDEKGEATRVRAELERLRGKPVHEIFDLPAGAGIEAFRARFFLMVKRFYPDRLHTDVSPELRQAYGQAFELLSSWMTRIERELSARQNNGRPAASYRAEDFIGFERGTEFPDLVNVKVRVVPLNADMFTQHPLANISSDAFFLKGTKGLSINTLVNVRFLFEEARHELEARGRVVWENAGDARQPQGLGIRFMTIAARDRQFIKEFARRAGP